MKRFRQYINEKESKGIAFFFGRLQPPTRLHEQIIKEQAKGYETLYVVIVEGFKSRNEPKNFLTGKERVKIIKKFVPSNVKVLEWINAKVYEIIPKFNIMTHDKPVTIIAGTDRVATYQDDIEKHSGELERRSDCKGNSSCR